jgi:catechol 2,3-dioxygenase-like lactoylglutathione lyase family enzyme
MLRQIAPVFFTTDIPRTLAYYNNILGFTTLSTWLDPPVYAIVARDQHAIHFRCAQPPTPQPEKFIEEFLDAYLFVDDPDALFTELTARNVVLHRPLADTAWNCREFVVKDCDNRLLAFGSDLASSA